VRIVRILSEEDLAVIVDQRKPDKRFVSTIIVHVGDRQETESFG
jgi:hypothetical protein